MVIAYCRGPYCVLSYEAVVVLRSNGRDAYRLESGQPKRRAAGFPGEAQTTGWTVAGRDARNGRPKGLYWSEHGA